MTSLLRLFPGKTFHSARSKVSPLTSSLKNWQTTPGFLADAKRFFSEKKLHRNIGISAHIDRYVNFEYLLSI
jgi:hypothetical protein